MELIEWILQDKNLTTALNRVIANKGAPGIDNMTVEEVRDYFETNRTTIKTRIRQKEYEPSPVRRVFIPKPNGKKRPLGIPTVTDRVVQQAVAQVLSFGYDKYFSETSYGFRPGRDCHQAINKALEYINEGYDWVIDMDISKFFDTVNHDKLISILRERINDAPTLHLIRRFLRAGVMENGVVVTNEEGVPQGGPLSPILANVYLDKLDKELEARGLRFVRYADDCDIFVKSGKAADRVMKSIVSWLERKLFLKVNAEKTKVVRPNDSTFLGFGFKRKGGKWVCGPAKDREKKFVSKCRGLLQRKKAAARSNRENFTKLNYTIRGWINYFSIGEMKSFMKEFGKWLRHRMRAIILKQWKRPRTIIRNLEILKRITHNGIDRKWILIAGNSRRGLYRRANLPCVKWLISNKMLETPTKDRPGLVNPLKYYLSLKE